MKFSDMAVFNKVAVTLSFTNTARRLGLSRSAVSKRIACLESDTGVVLFRRSPRSISLTTAGERLYVQTMKLDETLRLAREAVSDLNEVPSGKLSLSIPTTLGASVLPLLVHDFCERWPQIEMNVNMNDEYVNIVSDGYDVAIRVVKKLGDSSLIARRLLSTPEVILASPTYVKKFGCPQHVQELRDHHCLDLAKRDATWRFSTDEGPVRVKLKKVTTFNDEISVVLAACMDGGIIRVPRLAAESEVGLGRLVPILRGYASKRPFGVFVIYSDRCQPACVRVFVDFIEHWLPRIGELDRLNPLRNIVANGTPNSERPFSVDEANRGNRTAKRRQPLTPG